MRAMKFKDWVKNIPKEITNDPLWRMKVYQYALFLADLAWKDVNHLSENKLLLSTCDQLYRSAGSVGSNTSEGYSRRSKLDQARYYEYAMGSARECRGWYFNVRHSLSGEIMKSRLALLTEIIKMLLRITPKTRGNKIKEPDLRYEISGDLEEFDFPILG
jgi:four helix bundle protein